MKHICLSLFAFTLSSCNHVDTFTSSSPQQEKHEFASNSKKILKQKVKNLPGLLLKKKVQFPKFSENRSIYKLNLEQFEENPRVQKWIKFYTGRGRRHLQKHLDQGYYFKETVTKLLQEEDLPPELYYLALIESGFSTSARSHKSAVGVWQFIRSTGTRYGLRINSYVDERRDPIRSTLAAGSYLRDLHNVFHSWFLALSAYNTGESRILNLIFRHKTRDYWKLSTERGFPRETRDYVPKFIAAYLVGTNMEKYKFTQPNAEQMPELVSIIIPSPVQLRDLAAKSKVSMKTILKHNPNLLTHITPTYLKNYRIWFEKPASEDKLVAELKTLKTLRRRYAANFYRIKRGDNLIKIAKKFGISVKSLKRLNRMRSNHIVAGRKIRISSGGTYISKTELPGHYQVQKGDSLYKIAKEFSLTIAKLKELNGMVSNRIVVGERLRISEIADISHKKSSKCCRAYRNYTVKKGDSLYSLAKKYKISIKALKRLNSLSSSNIRIGQEIKIRR